jgi:hypothetical protein
MKTANESQRGNEAVQHRIDKLESGAPATPGGGAIKMIPGVYANRHGNKRLALAVVGRRVLYSWDDEGSQTIHLATCSAKNFITCADLKLIHPFAADEVACLLSRAVSLRPKRLSSKFEKRLFFGEKRMAGVIELIGHTEPQPQLCSDAAEPVRSSVESASPWYIHLRLWIRGMIGRCFARNQVAVAPV